MKTENLSTLKIHKLTQAQYNRELEAGRIKSNELYLTPNEEIITDKTLSISDVPADAKTVGDALKQKQTIIDVIELPTENINENTFYRLLHGSLVINQVVQNTYICHCVEILPAIGLPATNLDNTEGHVYYNVSNGELYGYVDATLSAGLGVPSGWYSAATLLGALGLGYAGIITNIIDDPKDDNVRLLLEYIIHSHKNEWISQKTIGWVGTGSSSEIFNDPANIASGEKSHAEGEKSHAEGHASHAEGYHSHAEGYYSHAEGHFSHAAGYSSHAEGHSYAEGEGSHAEGYCSYSESYYSHAEGHFSHAEGHSSHAEGYYSHAEGDYSHAEGEGLFYPIYIDGVVGSNIFTVTNYMEHVKKGAKIRHTTNTEYGDSYKTAKIIDFDTNTNTITIDRTDFATEDFNNKKVDLYASHMAFGNSSHIEGSNTIATGRSQHVQGEYNLVDSTNYDELADGNDNRGQYAHIVGNGTSDDNRSNAHTLDWNGNAWFAGTVKIGGASQDDGNSKELVTKDYVNNAIGNIETALDNIIAIQNALIGGNA